MADVFISYSRKDLDFIRNLSEKLEEHKLEVWVDLEGIYAGEEFWSKICSGIEDANAFLFVITPNSVASEYCRREIDYALKHNKRILPVLRSDVNTEMLHQAVASRQWIYIRENDDFENKIEKLSEAIGTDTNWVRVHTRLVTRAVEWDSKGRDNSFLLRGSDLQEAEEWLAQSGEKEPRPTELQTQYILSSREAETQRKEAEIKRQRLILGGVVVALVVVIVLGVFAWIKRNQAIEQANIALARQLTAQSELTRNQQDGLKLSVQLAAEAMVRLNSMDVHSLEVDLALRRGLALLPRYVTEFDLGYSGVHAIAFSPDGQRLIAASKYLSTRVYEIKNHQQGKIMRGESVVDAVALSPDGKYLATADDDGTRGAAQVLEAATLREVESFKYEGHVQTIALSPDGKYLAIQFWGGNTSVWDVAGPKEIARMEGTYSPLSFSPDGKYVATSGIKAGVWEVEDGQGVVNVKEILNLKQKWFARAVAFSPDGKYLVKVSYRDDTLALWDMINRQEVGNLKYEGVLTSVALSLGGKYVAVARDDYTIRVWETASNQEVARIHYGNQIYAVAFSPSGQYLAVGGLNSGVEVWEITGGSDIAHIKLRDGVLVVAFSPDEKYVVMADRTGTIINTQIGGVTNNHEVAILKQGQIADACAFSASGQYLAVSTDDGNVQVWETSGAQKVESFEYDGVVKAIALSPDGQYLSMATDIGIVHVWKVTNPREQEGVSFKYDGGAKALAVSPAGKYVTAVVGSGKISRAGEPLTARLWKLPKGEEAKSLELGWDLQTDLYTISPDGQYLAVANDNNVSIRDMESDQIIATLSQEDRLNDLVLSADGQYLAMAVGSTARVWEVARRTEIARIENSHAVKTVFFSPDGKYLVTIGQEGEDSENSTLKVWLLRPKDLITEACSRLTHNLTEEEWKQYLPDEPYRKTCPKLQ